MHRHFSGIRAPDDDDYRHPQASSSHSRIVECVGRGHVQNAPPSASTGVLAVHPGTCDRDLTIKRRRRSPATHDSSDIMNDILVDAVTVPCPSTPRPCFDQDGGHATQGGQQEDIRNTLGDQSHDFTMDDAERIADLNSQDHRMNMTGEVPPPPNGDIGVVCPATSSQGLRTSQAGANTSPSLSPSTNPTSKVNHRKQIKKPNNWEVRFKIALYWR